MLYIIGFTREGMKLGNEIKKKFDFDARLFQKTSQEMEIGERFFGTLHQWTESAFLNADIILFIGACGIAVRSIAPFLKDKWNDPAVLVMDEGGEFCISLLSGHAGGGNKWCRKIAGMAGACPVVTTATDLREKFSVDVFALDNGFYIKERVLAKEVSSSILAGEILPLVFGDEILTEEGKTEILKRREALLSQGIALSLESDMKNCPKSQGKLGIYVGIRCREFSFEKTLHLIPKSLILGLGCKKGTKEAAIKSRVEEFCRKKELCREAFFMAATIDLKKEEPGLLAFAENFGLSLKTYSSEHLSHIQGEFSGSSFVKQVTGVDNVCERSALACAMDQGNGAVLEGKYSGDGVTAAAAVVLGKEIIWDRSM